MSGLKIIAFLPVLSMTALHPAQFIFDHPSNIMGHPSNTVARSNALPSGDRPTKMRRLLLDDAVSNILNDENHEATPPKRDMLLPTYKPEPSKLEGRHSQTGRIRRDSFGKNAGGSRVSH